MGGNAGQDTTLSIWEWWCMLAFCTAQLLQKTLGFLQLMLMLFCNSQPNLLIINSSITAGLLPALGDSPWSFHYPLATACTSVFMKPWMQDCQGRWCDIEQWLRTQACLLHKPGFETWHHIWWHLGQVTCLVFSIIKTEIMVCLKSCMEE